MNTGGPNGWQPSYSFESMLSLVLSNMVDCESQVGEVHMGEAPIYKVSHYLKPVKPQIMWKDG